MHPRSPDRRTTALLAFVLLLLINSIVAEAQVFDLEKDRVPMAELKGLWRFHSGDDPEGKLGWANPAFDDSSWKLLRSDQPWRRQGFKDYGGFVWYRFQVILPVWHPPLAFFIPELGTSYQIFAGGRMIGQFGGLPPHKRVYWYHPSGSVRENQPLGQVMPIPAEVLNGKGSLIVAIRAWQWPDWSSTYNPWFQDFSIGDASLINDQWQRRWNYEFWSLSGENALLLGYLMAALAGLGLFVLRPSEREYLWFAAFEVLFAAWCAWNIYPAFHPVWAQGYLALQGLLMFLRAICLSMFFVALLKQRGGWPFWCAVGSALFGALMFVPGVMEWISFADTVRVLHLAWIPFIVFQLLILFLPAKLGNLDARLLLGPFGLQCGALLGRGLLFALYASGHGGPVIAFWAGKWEQLFNWPFPISVPNIADFLAQISILAILLLRFARTRRDEERFKSELEAARNVQQVLIPEEIPAIPGLTLECVYKPAGQVGGDFFQILPTANDGALIVIGDVSGKGMPAAMTVSLLVGTVRTLAHFWQSPGQTLSAMNQRMLARSKDGFTTCLVARVDTDGGVIAANAGHLSPYVGGREVMVENGLPLGLVAGAEYEETQFTLGPGEQLTLMTDGVVEAQSKSRELFGFERAAAMAGERAESIAEAAVAFGQQDDVTVVTVRRVAVTVTESVGLMGMTPSEA